MKRFVAGLAGFAIVVGANAQDASRIPIIDFIKPSEALSASLSPTGDYIAVSRFVNDFKHGVGITEVATNKITATLAFSQDESVGAYAWVGPRRLIASLAREGGRLDQPRLIGELYGVDADGKNPKYLFGYQGRGTAGTRIQVGVGISYAWGFLVNALRLDPEFALIRVTPWGSGIKDYYDLLPSLERMNVTTGKRKVIDKLSLLAPSIASDDAGTTFMLVGSTREGHDEMQVRAPGDKGWATIPVPGGTDANIIPLNVARDGSTAYFSANVSGSPKCLYELTFKTRAVSQMACGTYQAVVFTAAERKPMALRYEDGVPRYEYLLPDHPEARRLRAVSSAFPGQRVMLHSTTDDGSKVLISADSDRNPGAFYLLDEKTKSLRPLVPRRRWVDPRLMQPVAYAVVTASDGLQIPVHLTARDGLKTRQSPLVVLPHGGPHGVRDYWSWDPEAQLLASRGYAVLQVNFRGSGGYGEDFERAGFHKWGTRIQQDIADATRWAIAEGIADPSRICIYGASFGGFSAVMGAANDPDLYRCAAAYAGVYDLNDQVDDTDGSEYILGRIWLSRVVGTDPAMLREQSPAAHVGRIKAALLIAHGTRDRRVPFSQARTLRRALDAAGKPYEWLEYAGEEHGFFKQENEVDFYTRLLAFLDKHIGPQAAAPGKG